MGTTSSRHDTGAASLGSEVARRRQAAPVEALARGLAAGRPFLFRPGLGLHLVDVVNCCVPFQIVRTGDVVGQTLPDLCQRRLIVCLGVDELVDSIPAGLGCTVQPSEYV